MAERAQPLSLWPGRVAAGSVLLLISGALVAILVRADTGRGLGPEVWSAFRFTVVQAMLSAGLSVALAIPVARALARRSFVGRGALITLLGAPFLLPVIVAILGLLAVFGRAGWVSQGLIWIGAPPLQIYGLHGVVLAHVFFNLPLATRLILLGWQAIPAERFRLAAQLGCGPREIWRLLEQPMLLRAVPGALAVVFAICLTSFAVALTLGGGPRATTLELAIYQAFRFDFDLQRAAVLAVLQVLVAVVAGYVALRAIPDDGFGAGLDRPVDRWDSTHAALRVQDAAVILLASLFLVLPLLALILEGLPGILTLPSGVWRAALVSLQVAAVSTLLLLALALPMAVAIAQGARGGMEAVGLLGLTTSPLVIGTGLFVVLYPWVDPAALALPVTALVNAVVALPFALRILVPGMRDILTGYGRLALSLGMDNRSVLRWVVVPRLRPQIGFAAGLGAALSMGDLGVIVLFADPDRATLPLQIYRLMGSYRMDTAAAASLVLLILTVGVFWVLDAGGRRGAHT